MKICTICACSKPLSDFGTVMQRGKPYTKAACRICVRERDNAHYAKNRESRLAKVSLHRQNNGEIVRSNQRQARVNRIDEVRALENKWRAENKEKYQASRKAANAKYMQNNLDKHCAHQNKRRSLKLMAIPAWADVNHIAAIYAEAKAKTLATQVDHHVDHIVPLQGRTVCGLHVSNNLQIITACANFAKGNRQWPDMP